MSLSIEGCNTVTGELIVISTKSSDECTRRLTAPATPPEEKQQAAMLLSWLADQTERCAGLPAHDRIANRMNHEFEIGGVLDGLARVVTTEKNGVTRRTIEPVEYPPASS